MWIEYYSVLVHREGSWLEAEASHTCTGLQSWVLVHFGSRACDLKSPGTAVLPAIQNWYCVAWILLARNNHSCRSNWLLYSPPLGFLKFFASSSHSGLLVSSIVSAFSWLLSLCPDWASGKTNPPPCLPFRHSSWLTSSGKTMSQPPFDPKPSWNWVGLAGSVLSRYHPSFGRIGWAPLKPSAVTTFFFFF